MFKVTFSSAEPLKARFGGDSTFEPQMSEVIYVPVGETYDGSYDITPTEETQTLATEGLLSAQDFVIEAIPSNYVGSAIERRTESDISISGASISVPDGYYAESESVSVQSGSVSVPDTSVTANPSISFASGTGFFNVSVSASQSISPSVSEGYVSSGTPGTVTISGSASQSLPTKEGETITPTESVQTAVSAYKWTLGDVKIDAIPSNYVGSAIDRRSASDLSVSGATVSVPGGYYSADASKTISNATLRGGSRLEFDPTISVDDSGLITALYDHSTNISPINGNGYITTGARYSVRVVGSNTYQLTNGDVMSFGIVPLVGSAKVGSAVLCEEGE